MGRVPAAKRLKKRTTSCPSHAGMTRGGHTQRSLSVSGAPQTELAPHTTCALTWSPPLASPGSSRSGRGEADSSDPGREWPRPTPLGGPVPRDDPQRDLSGAVLRTRDERGGGATVARPPPERRSWCAEEGEVSVPSPLHPRHENGLPRTS